MEESDITPEKDNEAKTKELDLVDSTQNVEEANDLSEKDFNGSESMPSLQQKEEIIKKKYGNLLPKKLPLISKDHERAFFDSADWALGKKSKGPLEALRPKLEPSPHHQTRTRSAYAPADGDNSENVNGVENEGSALDGSTESIDHSPESLNQKN